MRMSERPRFSCEPVVVRVEETSAQVQAYLEQTFASATYRPYICSKSSWTKSARFLKRAAKQHPFYDVIVRGQKVDKSSTEAALRRLEDIEAWKAHVLAHNTPEDANAVFQDALHRGTHRKNLRRVAVPHSTA